MKLLFRILITAVLVLVISKVMNRNVKVDEFTTALTVAIVLGLLNFFVKPILVLFTLPITIFTLGLFLLVINALMILLTDYLVTGFDVDGFWGALKLGLILSIANMLLNAVLKEK